MTVVRKWMVLGGTLLCGSCAVERAEDPVPGDVAVEEAAVRQTIDRYLLAISRRDSTAISAVLPSDGVVTWIENGAVRYRSRDALLAGLASLPPGAVIDTRFDSVHVDLLGDSAAHAWGGFETSVTVGEGGYSYGGALSFIMRKDADSWHLVGGHASSPSGDGR